MSLMTLGRGGRRRRAWISAQVVDLRFKLSKWFFVGGYLLRVLDALCLGDLRRFPPPSLPPADTLRSHNPPLAATHYLFKRLNAFRGYFVRTDSVAYHRFGRNAETVHLLERSTDQRCLLRTVVTVSCPTSAVPPTVSGSPVFLLF
jgi:hypothetical protein